MIDVTLHAPPAPLHALLSALDQSRIRHHLERLCATEFAGRRIGMDGHDRAGDWLRATMASLGLAVDLFDFTLDRPVLHFDVAPAFAVLDAAGKVQRVLLYRHAFAEHPASADCLQPVTGLARQWRNGANLQGAWVMLETSPPQEALHTLTTQLAHQGASGILLPQQPTLEGYLSKRVVAVSPVALPVIAVRADLLGSLEGQHIQAHIPIQRVAAHGQQIIGQVFGTDSAQAQAPLIVGAHYDGVGDDPGGPRLPGAADNAAGVAVVLELARVVQASAFRPRRPIYFVAFDGEEVQAQGSLAYAQQLRMEGISPLVINLDGAARFNEAVWVEAGANTSTLVAALDQAGQWLEIPLILGIVASDNRRYAAAGFPSVGVALGGGGGHTPADTTDHVESVAMQMAAKLLLATLWQLAY
jgi:acetylornithine deacetylase/succinyl-diaminopimelate desuccinylase-like protein